MPVGSAALRDELLAEARRLGFAAAGVASARPFRLARRRALRAIREGRMAGMAWYTPERVDASAELRRRYPWARSVVSLAWPYRPAGPAPLAGAAEGRPRGRFSAYACLEGAGGRAAVDYHDLLAERSTALSAWLRHRVPELRTKGFVDHGWALDRAIAERAGLGFAGKHASLITREAGSYVMLAEILVSVALPPTPPSRRGCGHCRACLPACPTGAIVAPGVIDARRCISYLTIEHRGEIAPELRPLMGTWAFGCDLCQEACPINGRLAPPARDPGPATTESGPVPFPDLVECLELDDAAFARRFRGTAVWRAGRAGLARNSAIALGNAGDPGALPALRRAAGADPDGVVREAASWALSRLLRLAAGPSQAAAGTPSPSFGTDCQ
ncbi:MAG TPA: tRNA epoxyqueuosine(34) reductase QueG [Candidatus Binatia bacterium]|nr:tRNA epoxyqueuosine(34) reductase QueG [Candidatus Binatia bacterium]